MKKLNVYAIQHRLKSYAGIFATVMTVIKTVRKWKAWYENRKHYTVTITEKEAFYDEVYDWVLDQCSLDDDYKNATLKINARKVRLTSNTNVEQVIDVNGHEIKVVIQKPQSYADAVAEDLLAAATSGSTESSPRPMVNRGFDAQIVFTLKDLAGRNALTDELEALRARIYDGVNNKRRPKLRLLGGFSGNAGDLPKRDIETITLAEGQMDRILVDIQQFLDSEEAYVTRGIPYHRGYLLEGPPGTGKTSLAKAIAHHFSMDLYYYPLGNATSDSSLNSAFRELPPRCILLLEDVDVFSSVRERMQERDRSAQTQATFSLSGLLNVLDGVMTPEGVIIIMTSNDKESLDPAILRPGRCDLIEKLDLLQPGQDHEMFVRFYGAEPAAPLNVAGQPPAFMIEIMRRHMYDPCQAEVELRKAHEVLVAANQVFVPEVHEVALDEENSLPKLHHIPIDFDDYDDLEDLIVGRTGSTGGF